MTTDTTTTAAPTINKKYRKTTNNTNTNNTNSNVNNNDFSKNDPTTTIITIIIIVIGVCMCVWGGGGGGVGVGWAGVVWVGLASFAPRCRKAFFLSGSLFPTHRFFRLRVMFLN